MKKFSIIFILLTSIFTTLFNFGCQSTEYKAAEIPQTMFGYMKIKTGGYYRFYFCDINNNFVAYIDTSEVVTSGFERLVDQAVVLRGRLAETEKGRVIYADNIKLKATK